MLLFGEKWEVGSRQCLSVTIWVGREPLLLGKTSLGNTEPSLSLNHLIHEMGPRKRANDCSDIWSLPAMGGDGGKSSWFQKKDIFFSFLFLSLSLTHISYLSLCQGKLVQTNATGKLEREPSSLQHVLPKCILALNLYPTLSQVWIPAKSLGKQKHGSNTPSMCCHVALKIYVQEAGQSQQLMIRAFLRLFTRDFP